MTDEKKAELKESAKSMGSASVGILKAAGLLLLATVGAYVFGKAAKDETVELIEQGGKLGRGARRFAVRLAEPDEEDDED